MHDRVGQAGVLRQAACELGAAEDERIGLDLGAHRGRVRFVVDQTHLAQVVAGVQNGKDHLTAPCIGRQHPGSSCKQDVKSVRLSALLHEDFAPPVATLDHVVGDSLSLLIGQQ